MAKPASNQLRVTVRTETGRRVRRARRAGKIPAWPWPRRRATAPGLPGHDLFERTAAFGTNAVLTLDIAGRDSGTDPRHFISMIPPLAHAGH